MGRKEGGWYGYSIRFSQCLFHVAFPCFVSYFLLLFVDTNNYFGLRYHTRAQPFLTLFPFRPFFFFFSLSFYSLLGFLLPFFNYTLLSISFSLFPFLFPFSYVYSRKTYTLSIQPFTLDPTDGQGPGWIW